MIKEKDFIIYKTTNLINGKIYIGKDSNNNPKYLGTGSEYFQNALKKHGKENFKKEIIEYCRDFKHTYERERYWVLKLNPSLDDNIGYNRTIPNVDNCGFEWTNEMKKKQCENRKKNNLNDIHSKFMKKYYSNPENRKKLSEIKKKQFLDHPEKRKELSKKLKVVMNDPKIKKKLRENTKKQWSDLEYREKRSKFMTEYCSLPENKKKMSERMKKYYSNPENRKKASKSHLKYNVSKEELYNLYINQNKTQKEIAKYFNCCIWVIQHRLKKYKIKK